MRTLTALLATAVILSLALPAMAGPRKFRGNPDDAFAELDKLFTLRFFNAVNGKPIPGADVTFEGQKRKTNAEGAVRFPFPKDLPPGEQTRHGLFEREGYVRASVPIKFQVGTLFFNRFSVSPMIPIGYVRVVLDWDQKPKDLDAHLIKAGGYHISFRKTKNYRERAWLDRDDRDGWGPETVTVKKLSARSRYSYYIHNWSDRAHKNSDTLSKSKARVHVYSRKGLLKSFSIPAGSAGTWWHVFDVVKGQIVPAGTVGPRR